MFKFLRDKIKKAVGSRMMILVVVFVLMAGILVQRLFTLQIVNGEDYLNNFTLRIKKDRTIKSTRGEIYDRNGKALAYNQLAYSVTFEDNGSYGSDKERNLALNSSMYGLLRVIEDNGNDILMDYGITIDSAGDYSFTKEGVSLLRFKADVYGQAYVDDLKQEQRDATAAEIIEDLCEAKWYGILNPDYTAKELAENGLPAQDQIDKETILKLVIMRSNVAANSYKKYVSTTIAKDINEETVAIIMENKDVYAGVDVVEESIRVYDDSVYFAPIIGYTGQISQEELAEYNEEGEVYKNSDIVGKVGLEKTFEDELQGVDGSETVYVDNLGKVLRKDSEVAPQAGNDIYLTIDRDLSIVAYKMLEQYIAGIVYSNLTDEKEFNTDWITSADEVKIAVYDVYYALFENNILDAKHLKLEDASSIEQAVYQKFLQKETEIFAEIKNQLLTDNPTVYNDYALDGQKDVEWQAYQSYIVNDLLIKKSGILNEDLIDKADQVYLDWKEGNTSMQEYLIHALSKGWLDVSKIELDIKYLDTAEILEALSDYIAACLSEDDVFSNKVYKYMIMEESISGAEVCLLLFDQGVLEKSDEDYEQLASGSMSAYNFICAKIRKLELTPAQLALRPCSGSVVITDPNNGDVLACVTYPGYDNNRLANDMDTAYYNKLSYDLSSPFYNKATQEVTAPGSTFKMVSATAGVEEGVVSIYDTISCQGKFEDAEPPINCWIYSDRYKSGEHGSLTLTQAIEKSCNYYFNTVGQLLGATGDEEEPYDYSMAIEKLAKYAEMYGFDSKTGIEIDETAPHISDADAMRSAMGQSTHTYTTSQLARYVATIANSGTCYDLTLLDKITDSSGNTLEEQEPFIHNTISLSNNELWDTIHAGMNAVVNTNDVLKELKTDYDGFQMAGKTGTAQESEIRANHALFVGYAPYEDPEIAIAVRITNGYSSKNAASVARDIIKYRFGLEDESELITGNASIVNSGNNRVD